MINKLQQLEDKYLEIETAISDPETMNDMKEWQKLTKQHSKLSGIINAYREYKSVVRQLEDNHSMLDEKIDDDFRELVKAEIAELKDNKERLAQELKVLLLPKDPNDDKNIIVEIRGGAGGDEAALFAGDLFRMYTRYAEGRGWRTEILDENPTGLGGYKEIVFMINGDGAYSQLKYESGVHRVQRVPATESAGRIHTSTVTVAVLPEAQEVDIEINTGDLRIDTYCSSGAGGQNVNKTESAVRITHVPTNIIVTCQSERSQLQNKEQCMRMLRAKMLEAAEAQQASEVGEMRKNQVGSGDRSEKIRTYNFPQSRMTDHRIGLTLHKLEFILNGDLQETIDSLITADQAARLQTAS
ncbi:MAG: peptide chain release factor 1 [Negativicutes bacterium]|jgi:peptide chain release factor 1